MSTLQVTRRDSFIEEKYDPEHDFDKIIQQANEYLEKARGAIIRFKTCNDTEMDLLDCEVQIEKTLEEVSNIAKQLEVYIEEKSLRRNTDVSVSPRVLNSVKSSKSSLDELWKGIKEVKKNMQAASQVRDRKELFNDWDRFNRTPRRRQRDSEEITSDSTERLLNSKRILLEAVQASSGTLSSLATSSQSIDKNDQELQNQNDIVGTARTLLKKYGRRASTDKFLIWIGCIFFGCCAMIVVYRRLL